ncbi:MAG: hypothetical protein ABIE74_00600 [Pseudomonadota bacterium]
MSDISLGFGIGALTNVTTNLLNGLRDLRVADVQFNLAQKEIDTQTAINKTNFDTEMEKLAIQTDAAKEVKATTELAADVELEVAKLAEINEPLKKTIEERQKLEVASKLNFAKFHDELYRADRGIPNYGKTV